MLTIGDFNSFWGFLGHPVVLDFKRRDYFWLTLRDV